MVFWHDFVFQASDEQNRWADLTYSLDSGVKYPLNQPFKLADEGHELVHHVSNGSECVFKDNSLDAIAFVHG